MVLVAWAARLPCGILLHWGLPRCAYEGCLRTDAILKMKVRPRRTHYRIIHEVQDDPSVVVVAKVDHRRDVYQR
jgi:hypothetical protein